MGAKEIDKLLTTKEISEFLQIPMSTIKLYVACDEIPSIKIGRHRRFDINEVKKWLKKKAS